MTSRPNIVFVFADQLRHSAVGCYGNPVVRTPNLDRLAAQGIVFEQAFSGCPICSPYRGILLTGRYPHANGVVDNEYRLRTDQTTFAQALKPAGYRTAYVGKWHLGYPPYTEDKRYGFDYLAGYNCSHWYYGTEYFEGERGPITIDHWTPTGETDLAIRFIEEHRRAAPAKPFALFLSWGPPHWPYDRYPAEYRVYDPDKIDLLPNVPQALAAHARAEIAHYYGNVTGLDAEMGRLLAALDRLGLTENTIVCFSSDHGDHLYSHGYTAEYEGWMHYSMRGSKATPFDESVRIPFILRFPRVVAAGARTNVLLNTVDVMPTLLRLCGIDPPDGVQGADLSHTVRGERGTDPDSVYLQILGPGWPDRLKWLGIWRGVRTARWLYARWLREEHEPILFDRQADPYEMKNLAAAPAHASTRAQLEARLQQWMRDTGDPFDAGPHDPRTGMLLLGQEFTNDRWRRVSPHPRADGSSGAPAADSG